MKRALAALAIAFAAMSASAQSRLASDFEIERMRERIARSGDFLSRLSARLNLGDLYRSRGEFAASVEEYERALSLALAERMEARTASDLSSYSTATAYAALAQAKLGRGAAAFAMLEEAMRYAGDSAKTWNLYATSMTMLGRHAKSVAAARNAVALAEAEVRRDPGVESKLDLSIYEYTLAASLAESGQTADAEANLRKTLARLEGADFESLRRQIARSESFEIYSTARGEADAYLALLNRAGLRAAALAERRGDTAAARALYEKVLARRTDDAVALAALARLAPLDERGRWFVAAFDANPFSLPLIRSYRAFLAAGGKVTIDDPSAGARVRRTLFDMHRGATRAARESLAALTQDFPGNAVLATLRAELDSVGDAPAFLSASSSSRQAVSAAELRRLIALFERLTAEQRASLDRISFTTTATFDEAMPAAAGQTAFAKGSFDGLPFRFAEPVAFFGDFSAGAPLRLTYRIAGVTAIDGVDALLVEPLGLEVTR